MPDLRPEYHLPRPPRATPPLYAQDGKGYDAIVHAHYFLGSNDWLVTEYDPGEDVVFGWACIGGDRQNAELGYASLVELESIRALGFMVVELEEGWTPKTITEAITMLDRDSGRTL